MSWDQLEQLMLLCAGEAIEVQDKATGHRWQGTVDIVAPGLGKLWMYAELGERRLIDIEEHTVSKSIAGATSLAPPESSG